MPSIFLPPPKDLLKLAGIDSISCVMLNDIKKSFQGTLPFSEKTFKNFMDGKHKPHKATREKIYQSMPYLNIDVMERILTNTLDVNHYRTEWVMAIESFTNSASPDFFPYSRKKIAEIVKLERDMINEITEKNIGIARIRYILEHPFIHSFLNEKEKEVFFNAIEFGSTEAEVYGKLITKILLYCIALVDAEYGIEYTELYGKNFSVVKQLLPKMEGVNYINPIESLFRLWKHATKKTYAKMVEDITSERNCLDWRKGNKQASLQDIRKILNGIYPDLDEENIADRSLLYIYALFLSNLFEDLNQKSKINGTDIFRWNRDLVDWLTTNYERLFERAYNDIEELKVQGV